MLLYCKEKTDCLTVRDGYDGDFDQMGTGSVQDKVATMACFVLFFVFFFLFETN